MNKYTAGLDWIMLENNKLYFLYATRNRLPQLSINEDAPS